MADGIERDPYRQDLDVDVCRYWWGCSVSEYNKFMQIERYAPDYMAKEKQVYRASLSRFRKLDLDNNSNDEIRAIVSKYGEITKDAEWSYCLDMRDMSYDIYDNDERTLLLAWLYTLWLRGLVLKCKDTWKLSEVIQVDRDFERRCHRKDNERKEAYFNPVMICFILLCIFMMWLKIHWF